MWDLLRQVDVPGDDRLALDGAFLVDLGHLVAQVLTAVDQADGAELDG